MSTFENDDFKWRETYFVLFKSDRRPTVEQMRHTLEELNTRFELTDVVGDEQGNFESLTLRSPQDYAALDISYLSGSEVQEQTEVLVDEMKSLTTDRAERARLAQLSKCDARFDVMHFEQVGAESGDDDPDEMLDPSALLIALDALVSLTDGISIDPQAGMMM